MTSNTRRFYKEIKKFMRKNIRYKNDASVLAIDISNIYDDGRSTKLRCSIGYDYNDYEMIKEIMDAIHHAVEQYYETYDNYGEILISIRIDTQKAVNYFELSGKVEDLLEEIDRERSRSVDELIRHS